MCIDGYLLNLNSFNMHGCMLLNEIKLFVAPVQNDHFLHCASSVLKIKLVRSPQSRKHCMYVGPPDGSIWWSGGPLENVWHNHFHQFFPNSMRQFSLSHISFSI